MGVRGLDYLGPGYWFVILEAYPQRRALTVFSCAGTVLVVRHDKKDLTPEHVEAIAGFCRYKLSPQLNTLETYLFALEMYVSADGFSEEKDVATRKERFIEEEMCREKFEAYFENLKKFKVEIGNAAWEKVVSPYSV